MKTYLELIDLLLNDERIINKGAMLEYIEFISDMLELKIDKSMYIEKHHILPRSLFPDEINNSYNLIKLLPKYHYKAHVILAKMYEGGMLSALHFMENITKNKFNYYENLEIYNELRIKFSKMQKKILTERWSNPKIAKKVKENMKLAASKPEFKEKSSKNAKKFWHDKEFEQTRIEREKKLHSVMQSEDYKEKHRQNQKERMKDPEIRKKALANLIKDPRPQKTCPWCNQNNNTLKFFNTHFENCNTLNNNRKVFIRSFLFLQECDKIKNNIDFSTKTINIQHIEKIFLKNKFGTNEFYNYS